MFSLPIEFESSVRQIEHLSLKLDSEHRFITWWYGAIEANKNSANVPRVVVWFRQLNKDGTLGALVRHPIALSMLRQFRIGSVWHNQKSVEQLQLPARNFKVHFSGDHWKNALSVASHNESTGRSLIPAHQYGLRYQHRDHSRILVLEGRTGRALIPCLEFFARCYGHDEEINRVLSTYKWTSVVDRLLLDRPVESRNGAWVIKLPHFARNTDSHLLAHIRYDERTRLRVRRIQSDIDHQLFNQPLQTGTPQSARYAFPTIGPWFDGDAEIEVEGVPLENGDFLGLRITGYSVPSKPPIHCEIDEGRSSPSEGQGEGGRPGFNTLDIPEGQTAQTGDIQAPDQGSGAVIVKDPSIRILGNSASIIVHRNIKEGNGGKRAPPPEDPEQTAPGERSGSGKGLGRTYFTSAAVLESDGAILDLWNGLLHLKANYKEIITSVGWYTFSDGLSYDTTVDPKMVSLQFDDDAKESEELSPAAQKWIRFDSKVADKIRGVLIARVIAAGKEAYLFEVQRKRWQVKENDDQQSTLKEQKYCGLIVETPSQREASEWIPTVLYQIAQQQGIMSKVLPRISNIHGKDYRRSSSSLCVIAGEATARSALKKMGIRIPLPEKPSKKSQPE